MWFLFFLLSFALKAFSYTEPVLCGDTKNIVKNLNQIYVSDFFFHDDTFFTKEKLFSKIEHEKNVVLDWRQILQDVNELTRLYRQRGFFNATISACLAKNKNLLENQSEYGVHIKIHENKRARIKSVEIRGNYSVLKNKLMLSGLKDVYYNQETIEEYRKKALSVYHQQGFLEADVQWVQTALSSDFLEASLVFDVKEGNIYTLDSIQFEGEIQDDKTKNKWRSELSLKKGEAVNLVKLEHEVDVLLNQFRNEGLAFVQAIPHITVIKKPNDLHESGIISIRYEIIKGPLVYIRQFVIEGNNKVKEKLIRREIKNPNDRLYRIDYLKVLHENIFNLNYFSDVQIHLLPIDDSNEVDVLIKVVEKPTWFLSVFPFATSETGLTIAGIVADRNLFGFGIFASFSAELSSVAQNFNLTVAEARLFDLKQFLLFDIHRSKLKYPLFYSLFQGIVADYRYPLNDVFKIGFKWQLDLVSVDELDDELKVQHVTFLPKNNFRNAFLLSLEVEYLKLKYEVHAKASLAYSGRYSGSQLTYLEPDFVFRFDWCVFKEIWVKSRFEIGYLLSIEDQRLPIVERYFLGGRGSIRGYLPRTIGPKLGGVFKWEQSLEIEYPLWSLYGLKGYIFVDAGNAVLSPERIFKEGLYWSVGMGMMTSSFQFPLCIELSIPLSFNKTHMPFDIFFGFNSHW